MLPGLSSCLSCQSMIRDASITDYLLCESCAGNGTLGWVPELKRHGCHKQSSALWIKEVAPLHAALFTKKR